MGYAGLGFEVVGVDIEPQPNYPYEFIEADAIPFMRGLLATRKITGGASPRSFKAIHASPPCQAYSNLADRGRHPALIEAVRELLVASGLPYVIENVVGAPLYDPVMLCGSSFGLGVQRHRLFETNFPVMGPPCAHGQQAPRYLVYQRGRWYLSPVAHVWGSGGGKAREHWAEAMGIDWMTDVELAEAIPPAFTEHIGHYLMAEIKARTAACNIAI
jgi:DNA (cytosine-5)-methyltransferase 1